MTNVAPDARPQSAAPFGPTPKTNRRAVELLLAATVLTDAANDDCTIPSVTLCLSEGGMFTLSVEQAREMLATIAPAGGKQ